MWNTCLVCRAYFLTKPEGTSFLLILMLPEKGAIFNSKRWLRLSPVTNSESINLQLYLPSSGSIKLQLIRKYATVVCG